MNQQKQRPFSIKIFVPDVGWATSLPMRIMKNKQKMGNTVAHPTTKRNSINMKRRCFHESTQTKTLLHKNIRLGCRMGYFVAHAVNEQ